MAGRNGRSHNRRQMCPQRQAISQVVCSDRSGDFSAEDKKFRTKIAKRLKEGISVAAFASCPFVLRAGRNPRCDQGEAQAEHCAKVADDLLPRDLVHGGKTFTQLFRSHGKGGKVVMLENSLPAAPAAIGLWSSRSKSKTVANNSVKKSQALTRWRGQLKLRRNHEPPGGNAGRVRTKRFVTHQRDRRVVSRRI